MEESAPAYRRKTSEVPKESPVKNKLVNQTIAAAIVVAGILGISALNSEFKLKISDALKQNLTFAELKEKAGKYVAAINSIKNPFLTDDAPEEPQETREVNQDQSGKTDRIDSDALDLLNPGAEY
jgi:hypothetical protein